MALPYVVAVHLLQFDLWVLSLYRPPSYTLVENVTLLSFISDFCEGREVVILGEFNLPSLSWSSDDLFMGATDRDTVFLDCFVAAGLTQCVKEPTFVSSGTILDLFLTSE